MAVRVLYVTGWCRSGSTMLGNVLAESHGVFHTGELRFLWQNGVLGTGSNRVCGCGAELTVCPLWARVLDAGRPAGADAVRHAEQVVAWQAECRTRDTWRVLRRAPGNGWPETLRLTYEAIAEHTGARLIVDTSKFASDAALLGHLPGVQAQFLHLVRDPRGVAMSWLRPKQYTGRRGIVDSTLHWDGFNLAGEAVARRHPADSLVMRYEDLTADPRGSVAAVAALVGDGLVGDVVTSEGSAELGANHTVTGNPNRFDRGAVEVREDARWRDGLSRPQRLGVSVLAAPLLRRYRYGWTA